MNSQTDLYRVHAARQRTRVTLARATQGIPGIRKTGRVSGRLARSIDKVQDLSDFKNSDLILLWDSALRERVFEAAATSLDALRISKAITREAISALSVNETCREFALAHKHLALICAGSKLSLDDLMCVVAARWADSLPPPLSSEFATKAPTLHAAVPISSPTVHPKRRFFRRRGVRLPLNPKMKNPDCVSQALAAAIEAYVKADKA